MDRFRKMKKFVVDYKPLEFGGKPNSPVEYEFEKDKKAGGTDIFHGNSVEDVLDTSKEKLSLKFDCSKDKIKINGISEIDYLNKFNTVPTKSRFLDRNLTLSALMFKNVRNGKLFLITMSDVGIALIHDKVLHYEEERKYLKKEATVDLLYYLRNKGISGIVDDFKLNVRNIKTNMYSFSGDKIEKDRYVRVYNKYPFEFYFENEIKMDNGLYRFE